LPIKIDKADERHNDAGRKQRLRRHPRQFFRDNSETGASRHSVNQTDSEKRKRARGTAEEKVFQTCFRRSHIGLVERSHHVKGKAEQFEPNENHEQLFTADKQHQTDRC
jgi:hypothetical protein